MPVMMDLQGMLDWHPFIIGSACGRQNPLLIAIEYNIGYVTWWFFDVYRVNLVLIHIFRLIKIWTYYE